MFLFCLSVRKNSSSLLFSTFRALQLYSITLSCVLALEMRHKMSGLNQWKQSRQDYLRMDLCTWEREREREQGTKRQLMSDSVSSNRTSPESKLEHRRIGRREERIVPQNLALFTHYFILVVFLLLSLFHSSVWILNNITHHTVVTLTSSYINTFTHTHSHRCHQPCQVEAEMKRQFCSFGRNWIYEKERTNRKFVTTSNIWKVEWKKSCSCFLSSIKY